MVGLAALDPPYKFLTFRNRHESSARVAIRLRSPSQLRLRVLGFRGGVIMARGGVYFQHHRTLHATQTAS